jgi:hypothetical protein
MKARAGAGIVAWAIAAVALAGCGSGSVQQAFGYGKRSPDEFQVVRRQPLTVPPELRLRPPQPGGSGPAAPSTSATTYAALTGVEPATTAGMSPAERALVEAIPGRELPNVREVIAGEDPQTTILDRGTFLFILAWQRPDGPAPGTVIDPAIESQRLRGQGIVTTSRTASTPITTR